MHTPVCPRCEKTIPPEEINVETDIAFCRPCNLTHWLSVLQADAEMEAVDFDRPPQGAWLRREGNDMIVGMSYFSWRVAVGSLLTALFLNGILWSLFFISAKSLLGYIGWRGAATETPKTVEVSATMVLLLILAFSLYAAWKTAKAALLFLMGKSEMRLQETTATIHTKIGPWTHFQKIDLAEINDVWFQPSHATYGGEVRYDVMLGRQLGMRDEPAAILTVQLSRPISYFLTMAVRQSTRPRQIATQRND